MKGLFWGQRWLSVSSNSWVTSKRRVTWSYVPLNSHDNERVTDTRREANRERQRACRSYCAVTSWYPSMVATSKASFNLDLLSLCGHPVLRVAEGLLRVCSNHRIFYFNIFNVLILITHELEFPVPLFFLWQSNPRVKDLLLTHRKESPSWWQGLQAAGHIVSVVRNPRVTNVHVHLVDLFNTVHCWIFFYSSPTLEFQNVFFLTLTLLEGSSPTF